MYACLAVTCHLHFWQNDQGLLRATAVTQGWNGHRIRVSTQSCENFLLQSQLCAAQTYTFNIHLSVLASPSASSPWCTIVSICLHKDMCTHAVNCPCSSFTEQVTKCWWSPCTCSVHLSVYCPFHYSNPQTKPSSCPAPFINMQHPSLSLFLL